MRNDTLENELAHVMTRLRGGHDVLPFMQRLVPAGEAGLRPLPADMAVVLAGSVDWREPVAGDPPVWFELASVDDAAKLLVYRAVADGGLYVVAPAAD